MFLFLLKKKKPHQILHTGPISQPDTCISECENFYLRVHLSRSVLLQCPVPLFVSVILMSLTARRQSHFIVRALNSGDPALWNTDLARPSLGPRGSSLLSWGFCSACWDVTKTKDILWPLALRQDLAADLLVCCLHRSAHTSEKQASSWLLCGLGQGSRWLCARV